jgi:hypothetical protein
MSDREQRMYDALKRITIYMNPQALARQCERKYGLEYHEALEMAYENVLQEAREAILGMRRPKSGSGNE